MEAAAGAVERAAPQLSVIIVNYGTRDLLRRALDAVAIACAEIASETIVVDNGSPDDSVAMLRDAYPDVLIIANQHNYGFAAATNQGLALARGHALLLLNSDAAPEPTAVTTMLTALAARPTSGVVGPCLLNADGTIQSSRRRFPTLGQLAVESTHLARWWPFTLYVQRFALLDRAADHVQPVDWLVGACLLVRRAVMEQVGPLDPGFFLFAEELEWQWRIQRAGWSVWYEPAARVLHDGGRSSAPESLLRHQAHQASRVRLTRQLYGRPAAEIIRMWLLALDGAQLAIECSKWLIGHRPALRRRRMALYAGLMRSGLAMPAAPGGHASPSTVVFPSSR